MTELEREHTEAYLLVVVHPHLNVVVQPVPALLRLVAAFGRYITRTNETRASTKKTSYIDVQVTGIGQTTRRDVNVLEEAQ